MVSKVSSDNICDNKLSSILWTSSTCHWCASVKAPMAFAKSTSSHTAPVYKSSRKTLTLSRVVSLRRTRFVQPSHMVLRSIAASTGEAKESMAECAVTTSSWHSKVTSWLDSSRSILSQRSMVLVLTLRRWRSRSGASGVVSTSRICVRLLILWLQSHSSPPSSSILFLSSERSFIAKEMAEWPAKSTLTIVASRFSFLQVVILLRLVAGTRVVGSAPCESIHLTASHFRTRESPRIASTSGGVSFLGWSDCQSKSGGQQRFSASISWASMRSHTKEWSAMAARRQYGLWPRQIFLLETMASASRQHLHTSSHSNADVHQPGFLIAA
mmetsp:Transcript_64463/g.179324  ORF Transcript_64463/g.179324 Transcript_64463/m.179324 type:complete len:327 (+) Transcript_64463:300-1280(+)